MDTFEPMKHTAKDHVFTYSAELSRPGTLVFVCLCEAQTEVIEDAMP